MKKALSLLLTLATLVGILSVFTLTSSAATTKAFDFLNTTTYAKVYTLSTSGITVPYTNTKLNTRGTVTYGKSSSAYIDNKYDELYIYDVGVTNGKYWAKVSYPVGSGRATAYIPLSAITSNNSSHAKRTATGKFYCSYRKGYSTSSSYYVDKGDTVYLVATSGSQYQILYPVSGGKWRLAWSSKSNFDKYCPAKPTPNNNNTNKTTTSSKIKFNYSASSNTYTTSSSVSLTVNGTKINVGSIYYTYNYNGKYKTTGSTDGYTYMKVGSKYVNMNGWQCCAYARYIQYLMYGSQEFHNGKFVDVPGASGKATASKMKTWVNQAGVGAHIRSTRPHSLVVIGINNSGFYYTDSNVSNSNQVRVGYYTWEGFANSNYKYLEYICYYKG